MFRGKVWGGNFNGKDGDDIPKGRTAVESSIVLWGWSLQGKDRGGVFNGMDGDGASKGMKRVESSMRNGDGIFKRNIVVSSGRKYE